MKPSNVKRAKSSVHSKIRKGKRGKLTSGASRIKAVFFTTGMLDPDSN